MQLPKLQTTPTKIKHSWWQKLAKFRLLGLVGLIIAGSTLQIVTAKSRDNRADTCRELISRCEVLAEFESADTKDYKSAEFLARTDYAHHVTYRVVFEGDLASTTDTNEFIAQVAETLAHSRGWGQAGYIFNRVQLAAQADFSLTLIQAELLDNIPGCDSTWSCRSGSGVYINEDRWNGATSAWNGAGGSLRDYRHMVVNHEVGHWLGHGHYNCTDSPSNLAPVMQQQSISLQGCDFNPWPLGFELEGV